MPRGLATRWLMAGGATLVGFTLAGCASFWDEVTSREFKLKNLYERPDPMTVLRTRQQDGDALAKAIHQLKEPKTHGGSDRDQEEALQILATVATTDTRPLCRLAALEALGRFEDPRTTALLVQAYHNASASGFSPDIANAIRSQTLTALGHKKQPEGFDLLVKAATAPPEAKPSPIQQASFNDDMLRKAAGFSDAQAEREIRLAAVRALGESGNSQAIPQLLPLLQEKDVAIRDRAHQALQALTGWKDIPPDRQAWQTTLTNRNGGAK